MGVRGNRRALLRLSLVAAVGAFGVGAQEFLAAPYRVPGIAGAQAAEQAERVIELKIERGKLAGAESIFKAKQGDTVRLRWSTDAPVVLHLHGYDIERKVVPGKVTEFRFKAHATGRFPVNIHGARHGGAHHEPALMYLEVYPR